jgi:hypothetical protein
VSKLKAIICAVLRHSNIETFCFGYHYCGRCGTQLGDSLAGAYSNPLVVGVECDCDNCRANYRLMGFTDKFLAERPKWLAPEWRAAQPNSYRNAKRDQLNEALSAIGRQPR